MVDSDMRDTHGGRKETEQALDHPPPQPAAIVPAAFAPATLVLVVGLLYFGRDIFIPLALAALLSFVLAPVVLWLRRWLLPRAAAVVVTVVTALFLIGGLATVIGMQVIQLADNLPTYQRNIISKVETLHAMLPAGDTWKRALSSLRDIEKEVLPKRAETQSRPGSSPPPAETEPTPVPVVVRSPEHPVQLLRQFALPLLGPLGTAGLVLLFVVFILLEKEELRDRFIRLVGGDDLQRSTRLLTDGAGRVSNYLLMTLVVNVTYGIPIGIGLALIGVPNAVLWGFLAIVLRFIPHLGPWLAALFPIVIAFGSEPGWSMVMWTIALFIVLELISNNFVEPMVYGGSTGLSPFAVILAAIFWTVLWGPAGLVLSTPLTACIVTLGRYVPQMAFLGVLLGNDPVLSPAEKFYQRLLAGNVVEAIEQAERHIEDGTSDAFFETVALEALRMAESDQQRIGDARSRQAIVTGVLDVVEEVVQGLAKAVDAEHSGMKPANGEVTKEEVREPSSSPPSAKILCIAGRSDLDHAAARILSFRLRALGYRTEVLEPMAIAPHAIGQVDLHEASAVCLCYMSAQPRAYVRFACRRIGRLAPELRKILCLWNIEPDGGAVAELSEQCGSASVAVTSLAAAIEQVGVVSSAQPRMTGAGAVA